MSSYSYFQSRYYIETKQNESRSICQEHIKSFLASVKGLMDGWPADSVMHYTHYHGSVNQYTESNQKFL